MTRTAADQILKDYEAGDYFSCLSLPKPDCDDAGKPVWDVTDGQISKAFRKRSLAVHPDKNPSPEAKDAFEKLSDANRALRDPIRRGEALRKFADEAFKEKCRLHPEMMARMKREQEKRDASDYGEEIIRQQREHRERVRAMREKAQKFRKRQRDSSSPSSSDSDDDDEDKQQRDKRTNRDEDDAPSNKAPKTTTTATTTATTSGFKGGGARGMLRGSGRGSNRGSSGGGGGARRREGGGFGDKSESESDDDGGELARPVLGAKGKGGRKPRFIM